MISKHADCTCCKSCKESTNFRKIANLKKIGLIIYQYSFQNRDDKDEELLLDKSNKKYDAIILHNMRNVAISSHKCLSEFEKYKGCLRCKYIYEHAEKLLQRVQCVDKLDTIGICDHCRSKYENPCKVCCKIVKKFLASETQRKNLIKEMILWLSAVEKSLEKNEIYNNLLRQAGPLSHRHSLPDISDESKYFRRPKIGQLLSIDDTIKSSSHTSPNFSKILNIHKKPGETCSENAFKYKSYDHIDFDINIDESFSYLKFDKVLGNKDLKLKLLGKHKLHMVPFKISDQTSTHATIILQPEISQSSFKKNKLDKLASSQHTQRLLHKDFSYVFTKEKSKEVLPKVRRKSSSELIKETRERIETKQLSDKKEQEDKKKELGDIKLSKLNKQEEEQHLSKSEPDRKKQSHTEKKVHDQSGSVSKKKKDNLPPKYNTEEIKKKRDEKPSQLSPKTKTKKEEHNKGKVEENLPRDSPKKAVRKLEDNKEKIEKEKPKVKKDDKLSKSKEEKPIKTVDKPLAKDKPRGKSMEDKSIKQPPEQDKSKVYLEELKKLKAEKAKQREVERKLKTEEKKKIKETEKKSEEDESSKKPKLSSKKTVSESKIKANISQFKVGSLSSEDLILKLVKLKQSDPNKVKMLRPKRLSKLFGSAGILNAHKSHKNHKEPECAICNDSELELDIEYIILNNTKTETINDVIIGENILKRKHIKKQADELGVVPLFFKSTFQDDNIHIPNTDTHISDAADNKSSPTTANKYVRKTVHISNKLC